jgi:hypothetical protein
MTRIGRAFRFTALAGITATAALMIPASAAHADVYGCRWGYSGNGYFFFCKTNNEWPQGGSWRVEAFCDRQGRTTSTVYGPWVQSGTSYAYCPSGWEVVGGTGRVR